jgi:glycopeptide antibiotics resistance protein
MYKKLFWMLIGLGVFGVFYLSWLPQPRLENYWFMPKWLGQWTDAGVNQNLRTAIPFLFIGGLMGMWLTNRNKSFKYWVWAWVFNIAVVTIAELGQLFSAHRTCDIGDILWGSAGAFAGLVFISFGTFIIAIAKTSIAILRKPVAYKHRPQYG